MKHLKSFRYGMTEGVMINIIENVPGVSHTIILSPESRALKDEEPD